MLNICVDSPELEKKIKQTFGDDPQSIVKAFGEFIQQQKIKKDIGISISQLEAGESIPIKKAIDDIRVKYE